MQLIHAHLTDATKHHTNEATAHWTGGGGCGGCAGIDLAVQRRTVALATIARIGDRHQSSGKARMALALLQECRGARCRSGSIRRGSRRERLVGDQHPEARERSWGRFDAARSGAGNDGGRLAQQTRTGEHRVQRVRDRVVIVAAAWACQIHCEQATVR